MTWEELENECKNCNKCGLCRERKNVVIGRGNRSADILFVGEGPGAQEDATGKPFVGQAGQLLDLALSACGFEEKDYYIGNVIKCRPPENRTPLSEECNACIPHLRNQFKLIKPKMVVCLGNIASFCLIDPKQRISSIRGKWFEKGATLFTATFHPAALLRDESKKIDFYRDLRQVKEKYNSMKDGQTEN